MAERVPMSELTGNAFLDALPLASLDALRPYLEKRSNNSGDPIANLGFPVPEAVFPIESVVSIVTTMRDGSSIEVSLIGRDGFHGLSAALGDSLSPHDAMVQIPGSMWAMPGAALIQATRNDPALAERVLLYAQVSLITVAQFSGCNRLHPINERAARWLLMAHDRVANDVLMLTHEFLAVMLGVRRPGVSLAAATLDRAGFIEYRRGRITVRDRAGLESASCECYAIVADQSDRLLGYDIRKSTKASEHAVHADGKPR